MQLNEILEENSVKAISAKTNISEDNIEALLAEDFKHLSKAKALGFISIIERDYNADLGNIREQAIAYFEIHNDEENISLSIPQLEEKQGRSVWFPVLMLGLLAYVSWYFFTQYDNKTLSTMLPFSDNKSEVSANVSSDIEEDKSLSIAGAFSQTQTDTSGVQSDILVASIEPKKPESIEKTMSSTSVDTSIVESNIRPVKRKLHALVRNRKISLLPAGKLWFGIIDIKTGKKKNFSISDKYDIDVKKTSWLLVTSPAPFAFINQGNIQEYNDAKKHYFKVSKSGIESLSRAKYRSLGGYRIW